MLRVTSDLNNLDTVRNYVEEQAISLGLNPDDLYGVVLAVDEAMTNICVHGYENDLGSIEISVEREDPVIIIRIRDEAPIFDPTTAPQPNLNIPLEERPLGGMGVFLMKHYTDEITHHVTENNGNELVLKKIIKEARS